MTNSNQKGKRVERLLASKFRDAGWEARRGQQFKGTPDSPDVITELPLTVECKGVQNWRVYEWMAKLLSERKPGTLPLLCAKKNHADFLAIMPLDDFLELSTFVDWDDYKFIKECEDITPDDRFRECQGQDCECAE